MQLTRSLYFGDFIAAPFVIAKYLFSISATLRNFTERASLLPFDF